MSSMKTTQKEALVHAQLAVKLPRRELVKILNNLIVMGGSPRDIETLDTIVNKLGMWQFRLHK